MPPVEITVLSEKLIPLLIDNTRRDCTVLRGTGRVSYVAYEIVSEKEKATLDLRV